MTPPRTPPEPEPIDPDELADFDGALADDELDGGELDELSGLASDED